MAVFQTLMLHFNSWFHRFFHITMHVDIFVLILTKIDLSIWREKLLIYFSIVLEFRECMLDNTKSKQTIDVYDIYKQTSECKYGLNSLNFKYIYFKS